MKNSRAAILFATLTASLGAEVEEPKPPAGKPVMEKAAVSMIHLRQVGLALFAFDEDYGAFPDKETARDVKESTGTALSLGTATSNDYFRQLIASVARTEKIFQFGTPAKPADDRIDGAGEALAKGECDFAYLPGSSSASDPATPLVVGPLVPGKMKFDPVPLAGKAVVLTADAAVRTLPITADGDVILNDKSLFDPAQPFWKDRKPVVAWPE
jgi:hypothetical protein